MSLSVGFNPSSAGIYQTSSVSSKSGPRDLQSLLSGTELGADSATISGPAELFGKLKDLQSSDPAKFKQVTADIASKLKAAAGSEGGSGSFLTQLASQFQSASDTGDLSKLLPPQGGPPAGTYDSNGKAGVPDISSLTASSGVDLKSLFESIRNEVESAVSKTK